MKNMHVKRGPVEAVIDKWDVQLEGFLCKVNITEAALVWLQFTTGFPSHPFIFELALFLFAVSFLFSGFFFSFF